MPRQRASGVSIPKTVSGGLQLKQWEYCKEYLQLLFQYRKRYREGYNLRTRSQFFLLRGVSIPKTVSGGLQLAQVSSDGGKCISRVSIPKTVSGWLQLPPLFNCPVTTFNVSIPKTVSGGLQRRLSPFLVGYIQPCFNTENGIGRATT